MTDEHARRGNDWETEAARAAADFGIPVEVYKQALFTKLFKIVSDAGGGFAATASAAPAALPQGEYTELGQRAFSNNQKRIKQALDQYAIGDSSLVMTQQTLASIGLSDDRITALIEDVETEEGPTDET